MKINGQLVNPQRKHGLLMRHLPQKRQEGAANDWGPGWPLDWAVALPTAERIRQAYLSDVQFVYGGVSHLDRTFQTLALVAPSTPRIERWDGLSPPDVNNELGTWDYLASLKSETAAEVAAANPELFEILASDCRVSIRVTALGRLKQGEVAIFVTHNPIVDAVLSRMLGGINNLPVASFGKGDIAWLELDDFGNLLEFHYLPVPAA